MRLIALYRQPPDPQAFDQAYFGTHLPLMAKVPGLQGTVVSRFTRTVMGDGFYLMAEMTFPDEATLKQAMRSPQMAEAGANLATFAEGLAVLMFAQEVPPTG
ncbi:MAG TPA: EthD family reductase [Anaerolineales bacterium]|nr:EthD family reductase [Anaerolineales bacterium]